MLYEGKVLISHLKKALPIMIKLPILTTTGICRLLTLCQRNQNVLYCNIKGFKVAYDFFFYTISPINQGQRITYQARTTLKQKMIKIVLTIYNEW